MAPRDFPFGSTKYAGRLPLSMAIDTIEPLGGGTSSWLSSSRERSNCGHDPGGQQAGDMRIVRKTVDPIHCSRCFLFSNCLGCFLPSKD